MLRLSFAAALSITLTVVSVGQEKTADTAPAATNRLANESSPYLLQHAYNPVDWYPWGDEAIEKAKQENKMIFLSVGYAACHWCHVMERESFTDPEIAKLLNEKFVCIKVDREERPDVDQIYITAIQMISGNGGWPMSVFLLPDTRPFWGGTYFPARDGDRGITTGFLSILRQIDQAWTQQRDAVQLQAEALTTAIKSNQRADPAGDAVAPTADDLTPALVNSVAAALADQFDPQYGGFGYSVAASERPKFPEPSNLLFLMQRMTQSDLPEEQRQRARQMLTASLDGMLTGAMLDHLGGGFHRYSVDRRWQIPHFEKMLYDNGQLASVYAAAYQHTGQPEYRAVVAGIYEFVIRELRADGGAFYAALDADSEGEEGKFYRWTAAELDKLDGSIEGLAEARQVYRLQGEPNFEGEYFVPAPGRTLTQIASDNNENFDILNQRLAGPRQQLLQQRAVHARPLTDIKILTAWNGLMIAGLADAGRILQQPQYVQTAADAADFLWQHLRNDENRLQRSYAAGEAKLNGYLDDYAFYAAGLIALHRATGDDQWLQRARAITDKQLELFWDENEGGFFYTSSDHPALIVRVKDPVDSAVPSGQSVAAENLLYLSQQVGQSAYGDKLQQTLVSLVPLIKRAPAAAPRAATVLAEYLQQAK